MPADVAAERELEEAAHVVPGIAGDVRHRGQRVGGGGAAGRARLGEEPGAADALVAADRQQVGERVEGRGGWRSSPVGELAQDLAEATGQRDEVVAHRRGVAQAGVRAATRSPPPMNWAIAKPIATVVRSVTSPAGHPAFAQRQGQAVGLAGNREARFGAAARAGREQVLDLVAVGARVAQGELPAAPAAGAAEARRRLGPRRRPQELTLIPRNGTVPVTVLPAPRAFPGSATRAISAPTSVRNSGGRRRAVMFISILGDIGSGGAGCNLTPNRVRREENPPFV